MKTIANRIDVIALAAAALGTVAYSQSARVVMRAEVPFSFHTSHGTMPAGKYEVTENFAGVRTIFAMRNTTSNKTVLISGIPADAKPAGSPTILSFRCGDTCELAALRTSRQALAVPDHRSSREKEVAMVAVPLTVSAGE